MNKQHDSRIPWVTLILCVCLANLVILPILLIVGTSVPSIPGMDFGNSNYSDQTEADDFFTLPITTLTIAGFIFSKFSAINLDFQSAFLSPDAPPPK